jgi:hypothetical protein
MLWLRLCVKDSASNEVVHALAGQVCPATRHQPIPLGGAGPIERISVQIENLTHVTHQSLLQAILVALDPHPEILLPEHL